MNLILNSLEFYYLLLVSTRSRLCSSERIRIYPTHAAMTGTRYHFCDTIISRVALAKPPSQNHPSNPPRCRVSILKITISRRSPSFHLSLYLFPISLFVRFPFLRLPLRRLMRFGFSSFLFCTR